MPAARPIRPVAACSIVAALVAAATPAFAEPPKVSGFAMNRFEPSERGSEWFVLDSLDMRGAARPIVGAVADYDAGEQRVRDDATNQQVDFRKTFAAVHVGGALVLYERLRIGVDVPMVLAQSGTSAVRGGLAYDAPSKAGLGDARLALDVRVFGRYRGPATAALGLRAFAPTGSQEQFTGDGAFRVGPHASVAGELGPFVWAARAGVLFRSHEQQFIEHDVKSEVDGALALGARVLAEKLVVGPELVASTQLSEALDARTTPSWALGSAHYTSGHFRVGVGAGPGLSKGIGNATFRAVGSVEWSGFAEPVARRDRDHDGIADADDACPDEPGEASSDARQNGCSGDRDRDGVADAVDACPDAAGPASADLATSGCPGDSDGDGIADPSDACPRERGVANADAKLNGCPPPADRDADDVPDATDACPEVWGQVDVDPAKNGCPVDTDGDGIAGSADACPSEPGTKSADPTKNGCPVAKVEGAQIRILEQIKFQTNSASILAESAGIIEGIAAILKASPDIKHVRIEGHTDDRGPAFGNKFLSKQRAEAVRDALVKQGVEAARLGALGVGQERPLVPNDSEANRALNRRVEFHIEK